jgi:hypothetical protein
MITATGTRGVTDYSTVWNENEAFKATTCINGIKLHTLLREVIQGIQETEYL